MSTTNINRCDWCNRREKQNPYVRVSDHELFPMVSQHRFIGHRVYGHICGDCAEKYRKAETRAMKSYNGVLERCIDKCGVKS